MGQASALLSDKNLPSTGGKQTSTNSKGVITPQQQQPKPSTASQMKNQQVVNQINQIKNNLVSSNQNAATQGKKSLDSNPAKKPTPAQLSTAVSNVAINAKKQKTSSFNNNNQANDAQ